VAAQDPDRLAILNVRADGGTEDITFGWLRETSNRLANTLAAFEVARGDRVAVLLPQTPEAAAGHIAIYKLGAVAVPLAILFGVDALSYRLQNAGVKAVVTNAQGLAKLNEIRSQLPDLSLVLSIDGPCEGALGFRETIARGRAPFNAAATTPDDPALMIFTSGTTGRRRARCMGIAWCLGICLASRCRTSFFRKLATGSGRRPTGRGPAGCSTACCRACITACRWWRGASRSSIRRRRSPARQDRRAQRFHPADRAAHVAFGANRRRAA